ncbi:MFS transporter [Izhakiella australiensis]|uniref:MFS transporter n=1 Tax=Izhakiella australiensis TaxID=1926881 RepID=A0A1S8YTC3_9GAMM|nr:MFS transporter [Izhakiella australiensis]OON42086.1 MFS transporter [Izhakiella australiensis]
MLKRLRWTMVFMLFMAGVISYLDRAALSVAAPLLTKDLHLDPAELGIVFSSFFVGYSLFCFVGGQMSDRFGPKKVLLAAMLVWSLFCTLTAGVAGILSLLVVRVVFGMGEGPYATCTNKIIFAWFTPQKRTSAIGLANAGQQVGGAIAGPLVGLIAVAWGWRVPFIIIGALGLVWLIVWHFSAADSPRQHPLLAHQPPEENLAAEPNTPVPAGYSLGHYLRRPTVLATSFAFFAYAYILYFFLSWFPSYLMMERHMSLANMSWANIVPWVFGAAGVMLGGIACDALYRKLKRGILAHKIVIIASMLISACCVALAGQAYSIAMAIALMSGAAFFTNLTLSTYWGIISETVEPGRLGGVGGFMHLVANTAGIIAPSLTGFLVKATGTFQSAFLISGAVALLGALAVAFFASGKQRESLGAFDPQADNHH